MISTWNVDGKAYFVEINFFRWYIDKPAGQSRYLFFVSDSLCNFSFTWLLLWLLVEAEFELQVEFKFELQVEVKFESEWGSLSGIWLSPNPYSRERLILSWGW